MAVSVMFYHYVDWSLGSTSGLVAKLGIYAVSVFYILSGLSLTLAYRDRLATWTDLGVYGLKRLFRIAPLFWLATTATLAIALARSVVNGTSFTLDAERLLANYSLTFGFFAPDAYYATGAWSIGNEMVFYAAFPVALWLFRRSLTRSILAAVAMLFLAVFAFVLISPAKTLSEQWAMYIHPLNQIPFFLAGMLIATLTPRRNYAVASAILVLAAVAVFCLLPFGAERIGMVVGTNRIVFTLACVAVVLGVYASGLSAHGVIHRVLSFLGDASYSIYLLHPIVAFPVIQIATRLGLGQEYLLHVHLLACVPITLLASWLSYRFLEQPGMRLGQNLAAAWRSHRAAPLG